MAGLIAKKIGMTQVIGPNGQLWPVTALQVEPQVVTEIINSEDHSYRAYKVGFGAVKSKHNNKSNEGYFKALKLEPKKHLKEFRLRVGDDMTVEVGQTLSAEVFGEGNYVDVSGKSIGKSFQGVIKRWNCARGPETHGSMSHRQVGSIGMSSDPSRTLKGQSMPGHMGNVRRTTQNLLVVKIMKDDNLILVRGSVPGSNDNILEVRTSFKKNAVNLEEKFGAPKIAGKNKKK
ncbi:MAG: large subunit ribosomal protein L3 [Candidatus Omnitrophota bacterium]|jgi:large subunit ribosomal protein L3